MSNQEICHYPPINSATDHPFQAPNTSGVHKIYERTGFPETVEGRSALTAFLRGSTAAYLPENGIVSFRHPASDVDFVAITEKSMRPLGVGYHAAYLLIDEKTSQRDAQVLYMTEDRFYKDLDSRFRAYLLTKLAPPVWPVLDENTYKFLRAEALSKLITRGATRNGTDLVTPSGAAQLILEERLFSEPWRWLSLRSYFVSSPHHMRERQQLLAAAREGLELLVTSDRATSLIEHHTDLKEDVFRIKLRQKNHISPHVERMLTLSYFVFDQLVFVLGMSKTLSFANIQRIIMKGKSVLANPLLRYDADLIFGKN